MHSEVSISKLKNMNERAILIDIRDENLFNKGNIPNSINIPVYKLLSDPSFYLNQDDYYYIYCTNGISSLYTCKILIKSGYKVLNVTGGYRQWLIEK